MVTIIMASLLVLGGVGIALGAVAAKKSAALWNVCRYYYLTYAMILIGTLMFLYMNDPSHPSLLDLGKEFSIAIVASVGWGFYAHLAHTNSHPDD